MLARPPSGGGREGGEDCHRRRRRGRRLRLQCLAIIQSDFQTDSRMRANLASEQPCVWQAVAEAEAEAATAHWQVVEGRGREAKAANEGREMTVIQPLLPYNLKQCVMELSSPSYCYLPLPPSLPKKSTASAASSHVYVIDNCFHLESRK